MIFIFTYLSLGLLTAVLMRTMFINEIKSTSYEIRNNNGRFSLYYWTLFILSWWIIILMYLLSILNRLMSKKI